MQEKLENDFGIPKLQNPQSNRYSFLFLGERPTLFSDIWSLAAVVLQWLLETPPWDFQELCARYKYRENKHVCSSFLLLTLDLVIFLL